MKVLKTKRLSYHVKKLRCNKCYVGEKSVVLNLDKENCLKMIEGLAKFVNSNDEKVYITAYTQNVNDKGIHTTITSPTKQEGK